LLLSSGDYKNPQNSKVFARLLANKNEQVKQLAGMLQQAAMRSVADVPWFEETISAAEKGTLGAQVAAMPAPNETAGASWLTETESVEGSRPAASRPAPEVSRPSPGFGGTRPAPPAGPTGTRVSPPHPTPAKPAMPTPAAKPASAPAPQRTLTPAPTAAPVTASYNSPAPDEKSGSSRILLIIGAIAIIGLIIFIFASQKPAAPNLDQRPAGQQR
jgi:hypothetical protein